MKRVNSNATMAPRLWPKNANRPSRHGAIASPTARMRGAIDEYGGSAMRISRPGGCIAQTSISPGRALAQLRKIDAPPPAYGKQKRRILACGRFRGIQNHG